MKYFAVILHMKDQEAANEYKDEHIWYMKELCAQGHVHLVGKLVEAGGLVIFKAECKEDVEQLMAADPFIVHGARSYELYEWHMHTAEEYIK